MRAVTIQWWFIESRIRLKFQFWDESWIGDSFLEVNRFTCQSKCSTKIDNFYLNVIIKHFQKDRLMYKYLQKDNFTRWNWIDSLNRNSFSKNKNEPWIGDSQKNCWIVTALVSSANAPVDQHLFKFCRHRRRRRRRHLVNVCQQLLRVAQRFCHCPLATCYCERWET